MGISWGVCDVGRCHVPPKARMGLQSVAASAFATSQLLLVLADHLRFADQASLAVEARMAALGAERFARIARRCRQLGAAARIAAAVSKRFGELSHDFPKEKAAGESGCPQPARITGSEF